MSTPMDLYLIQDPRTVPVANDARFYNTDLLRAYHGSLPVKNVYEFIARVHVEVGVRHRLIRKLVIGAHGAGPSPGYGDFHLGTDRIEYNDEKILLFRALRGYFAEGGAVYILSCRTGVATPLLSQISRVLGGIPVHGYTDYITTTNYWITTTVDDGTDDGGSEIVCWPTRCENLTSPNVPAPKAPSYISQAKF